MPGLLLIQITICLKTLHFKIKLHSNSIQCYDQGMTVNQIYAIDQVAAMHLSWIELQNIVPDTVRISWNHT